MSESEYDQHVIRRNQAEREITLSAYGNEVMDRWQDPWVRDEDGFWILACRRQQVADRTRTIRRPDLSDVDAYMEILSPDQVPAGTTAIDCAVTRLNSPEPGSRSV